MRIALEDSWLYGGWTLPSLKGVAVDWMFASPQISMLKP